MQLAQRFLAIINARSGDLLCQATRDRATL